MGNINIVRGDLKSKPESSKQLADFFESMDIPCEGTLYVGYPIIGTSTGGYQIDALFISREKGLIVFNIEEGIDNTIDYKDIQDENFTKLQSKLVQNKELTQKRKLVVDINTVTYAPSWSSKLDDEDGYKCCINNDELTDFIESLTWPNGGYYENLMSVIQSVTTIRQSKSRAYVKNENSRGSILKKLEDSIANLDRNQSAAVIETVEGVQRVRGLAGSGKTIILALKVAYLHAKNPEWKIAVTFNTRSLKDQFRKYIRTFSYEHSNAEPNWDNIDIIHAWGMPTSEGIYFNICKDHNIEYLDFTSAKQISAIYGKEFDAVCIKALNEISVFKQKYDLIVIDEAQDFSKEFLRLCYSILKDPKRLVYAYDELQSLNTKLMPSPEELFGKDDAGKVLVNLVNDKNKPKADIVLYKCYRNPLETLTAAHALGFGVYRDSLVQMFDNSTLWKDVGYEVTHGNLADGENVVLKRNSYSSPDFLSEHSDIDDLLVFKSFNNDEEQVDYVVSQIEKNIKEDELNLDDIMVINTDPLTTKKVVGVFRQRLFDVGINSNLAGVTSSPDVFYTGDAITFTGIFRAKGNEAAMVYVINSQYCYSGVNLSKRRNILFTAMTRSKAWVRVCGYGEGMQGLVDEYNKVKGNEFTLSFKYPTADERAHLNIVNRDMSEQERERIQKNQQNLNELFNDLSEGRIKKEDIPNELLDQFKKLITND